MRTLCIASAALALLAGCKREERQSRLDPPVAAAQDTVHAMPNGVSGRPHDVMAAQGDAFRTNAYQLSQGKRLYEWFNCQGCHADGGGASAPALMNGWWRYGPDPVSVFISIRDGRPNGMPSYRDKLTAEQIWQLTGYVQTLGASTASLASTSRNDAMQSRPAENRAPAQAGYTTRPSP